MAQASIECGFCLRQDDLPSPKVLPCTHVHCLECLRGFFGENNVLVCPVPRCGLSCNGSPDTLPSHDMVGEDNKWCDVCVHEKFCKEVAVTYCTDCSKNFCDRHQQSHDEVSINHVKMGVVEHRAKATKQQNTNCTVHKDQPYTVGCRLCLTLGCTECLPKLNNLCVKGETHSVLPLDDLVADLINKDIRTDMVSREDVYEKLFKETSKARAEYDNKTSEMVRLVRQTKDAQVSSLKFKYEKLEDEVVEKRQKTSIYMAEFMEDVILKRWTQLRNYRQLIESRMKSSHRVNVVRGMRELKEEIQKSVEEEIPKLELRDQLELKRLDESRVMELEISISRDIVIDSEQGMTTLPLLPQSMTLLKSIQLPAYPLSVYRYKGNTYVGLYDKTVTKIDKNCQLHNSFISTPGKVESIAIYQDRFYILSHILNPDRPLVIGVYHLSGSHIASWSHPHYAAYASDMLTVQADQVVVADPRNKRLVIYSLAGELLRRISCRLLMNSSQIATCAVDDTSIVVCNCGDSKVFKVNVITGEVMWTLSDITMPEGLVLYRNYIILAAYNRSIYVLDISTGKIVSKLKDCGITNDPKTSLEVFGATLMVPEYSNCQLLFFQLNKDA